MPSRDLEYPMQAKWEYICSNHWKRSHESNAILTHNTHTTSNAIQFISFHFVSIQIFLVIRRNVTRTYPCIPNSFLLLALCVFVFCSLSLSLLLSLCFLFEFACACYISLAYSTNGNTNAVRCVCVCVFVCSNKVHSSSLVLHINVFLLFSFSFVSFCVQLFFVALACGFFMALSANVSVCSQQQSTSRMQYVLYGCTQDILAFANVIESRVHVCEWANVCTWAL